MISKKQIKNDLLKLVLAMYFANIPFDIKQGLYYIILTTDIVTLYFNHRGIMITLSKLDCPRIEKTFLKK